MLTRMLILATAIFGGLVFLSGAWPGPLAPHPHAANSAFLPQPFSLDSAIIGSGIGAKELLENALAKLDWKHSTWLHTKIRQTMSDPESRFVAHGFLQRGPNQCARLELEIDSNGGKARLLVVSDGATIATVREVSGAKPSATVHPLPETNDLAAKEEFLRAMNCHGPASSLKEILAHLETGTMQTGTLNGKRVILICANLKDDAAPDKVRRCQVYLDADSLWPCQIEWYGANSSGRSVPQMRVEFDAPEIDRELSVEECARLFSYQP